MNRALQTISPASTAGFNPTFQDQWVLLWSQSQCALHIEPAVSMIKSNLRAYAEDRRMDYVPLFMGERKDCDSIAASVRGTLRVRAESRPERVTI